MYIELTCSRMVDSSVFTKRRMQDMAFEDQRQASCLPSFYFPYFPSFRLPVGGEGRGADRPHPEADPWAKPETRNRFGPRESVEAFVFCAPTALNTRAKGNALEQSHPTHHPSPEKGETR
jgi:hypothetical protein